MKSIFPLVVLFMAAPLLAGQTPDLQALARQAASDDAAVAAQAIHDLRSAGQPGLDALLAAHVTDRKDARVRSAVDAVAMQKDACESGLYWYTDLSAAMAESQHTSKPILALRMLGNLSDDQSCANSRFFRTTLYCNAQVSQYLRDHFVLEWQSVHNVPVITIDFGDGRKIVRTITGNSIHYVLDSDGRVIDGIPGVYGPQAFLRQIQAAHDEAVANMKLQQDPTGRFDRQLSLWQADRLAADQKALADDLRQTGLTAAPGLDDGWKPIAQLHAEDAVLDDNAKSLMAVKIPADVAMPRAQTKLAVENPLLRIVRNVQGLIAIDSVRNEFLFHAQIHQWLAAEERVEVERFNTKVYAELFKSPLNDPWMGLAPPDVYSGLDQGGLVGGANANRGMGQFQFAPSRPPMDGEVSRYR